MLFNAPEFILLFLPVVLAIYYYAAHLQIGTHIRKSILILASLFFYGFWRVIYLPLLLSSIIINYALFRLIRKYKNFGAQTATLGVIFNLCLIGWFKYMGFFIETFSLITGFDLTLPRIILPLAISFFTFQQIAFLVDASRRADFDYSFIDYAFFVSFFPQLIAGPIVHHRELANQAGSVSAPGALARNLRYGLVIFALGLTKKVLIADRLADFATPVFAAADAGSALSTNLAWQGALAYTFQLYFDFSGYSDMAIGLGAMFGMRLPVNFNAPYLARNIGDFWHRWHITLSDFLREYLYVPLGGNRHGSAYRYRNLMLTMLLGGLWHGAGWNFILWGGLHGAALCIHHAISSGATRVATSLSKLPLLGWLATMLVVVIGWVLFRAETLHGARTVLLAMVSFAPGASGPLVGWLTIALAAALSLSGYRSVQAVRDAGIAIARRPEHLPQTPRWGWAVTALLSHPLTSAGLLLACLLQTLAAGAGEFLYFNF